MRTTCFKRGPWGEPASKQLIHGPSTDQFQPRQNFLLLSIAGVLFSTYCNPSGDTVLYLGEQWWLWDMDNWMRLSERSEDLMHHLHEIWIFPSDCTKRKLFAETFVCMCNKKGNLSCQQHCTSVIKVTQRNKRKNFSKLRKHPSDFSCFMS